jgi:hypothetical protein
VRLESHGYYVKEQRSCGRITVMVLERDDSDIKE